MENRIVARPSPTLALSVALSLALLSACASGGASVEEEVPSAEGYYQRALEKLAGERVMLVFSDVDYAGAIELFQEVIDNYPYSDYATQAELKIADVHFDQESFEEAASFYQDFVELHPTHPQVPYAIYRNGLCAFARMREPHQDQTPTEEAISHFRVLVDRYPNTPMAEAAAQQLQLAEDQLALADVNVGDFYFGRGEYFAAIKRYRNALIQYPHHTRRWYTMARLATSLKRLHRYYEAERLFAQVLAADVNDDDLIDHVRTELDEIESGAGGEILVLPRSCVNDPNPACQNGNGDPRP